MPTSEKKIKCHGILFPPDHCFLHRCDTPYARASLPFLPVLRLRVKKNNDTKEQSSFTYPLVASLIDFDTKTRDGPKQLLAARFQVMNQE